MKKLIWTLVIVSTTFVVGYRIKCILKENVKTVFNIARNHESEGIPANTLLIRKTKGILYEPVTVNDNKIYVSGTRISKFKTGQKIQDGGLITSVHKNIDIDTGLFLIETADTTSGNHFVEFDHHGIFIPLSSISNSMVQVLENQTSMSRRISIVKSDAKYAMVEGLMEGDILILNKIEPNMKVRIVN